MALAPRVGRACRLQGAGVSDSNGSDRSYLDLLPGWSSTDAVGMVRTNAPARGRHQPPRRAGWLSQRVKLTLLLVAVAVATVAVPPLVAPDRPRQEPSAPAAIGPPSVVVAPPTAVTSVPAVGSMVTPVFSPLSVEAEDPGNLRSGGAKVFDCDQCDGGQRVGYLVGTSQLSVRATLSAGGTRTITVVYETDGPRTLKVSLNAVPLLAREVTGSGWETPRTFQFTAALPAGQVLFTFYNDDGPAPDVDKLIIS
jgi:hypothetical protein